MVNARRAEAELLSRKKSAQVALDDALASLAMEGESLVKIQDVAVKEADAERTSHALENQTSAMQQEVKELRLSKETLGHQVKALTAEVTYCSATQQQQQRHAHSSSSRDTHSSSSRGTPTVAAETRPQ